MESVEWTPWRNLRLRLLWGRSNVTIEEICTKLGRIPEDDVRARAEQLHLGVRRGFQPKQPPKKPDKTANMVAAKVKAKTDEPSPPPKFTKAECATRAAVEEIAAMYESRGVPLLDLKSGMCRWPITPFDCTQHLFCGREQQPGKPYCTGHANLAYRKSRDAA